MVGVLVDRWGTEQAEGLLHFFEGWIIFLACASLLTAEIFLFARLSAGKGFFEVFQLPQVTPSLPPTSEMSAPRRAPLVASFLLLGAAGMGIVFISERQEIVPDRTRFVAFPNTLGQWQGRPSMLEPQIEHALGLGIGKWFLLQALYALWVLNPTRVVTTTNTLDHPRALQLYQMFGFSPVSTGHGIVRPLSDKELLEIAKRG